MQLLGDKHGGLVHLFERDCSIQRRHQKVVEIAPAPDLPAEVRQGILDAALAIGRAAGIDNASTVEFLYDVDAKRFYFIEVNPRIQVEHTVTEVVTGFDIVRHADCMIAAGAPVRVTPTSCLGDQSKHPPRNGFAIQCRVTTEDPASGFVPGLRPPQRVSLVPAGWGFDWMPAPRSAARSSRRSTIPCW